MAAHSSSSRLRVLPPTVHVVGFGLRHVVCVQESDGTRTEFRPITLAVLSFLNNVLGQHLAHGPCVTGPSQANARRFNFAPSIFERCAKNAYCFWVEAVPSRSNARGARRVRYSTKRRSPFCDVTYASIKFKATN